MAEIGGPEVGPEVPGDGACDRPGIVIRIERAPTASTSRMIELALGREILSRAKARALAGVVAAFAGASGTSGIEPRLRRVEDRLAAAQRTPRTGAGNVRGRSGET